MLIDYHMHTRLTDGVGDPVDYARVADAHGLSEIGCSDHAPLDGPDPDERGRGWTLKLSDLDLYVDLVREAQQQVPQLPIKLGLEVDYVSDREGWIRELAAMYPWDFLLGSVHFLGDWPVDLGAKDWEGRDIEATWREYFELWKQAARSRLFDSMSHPDLPKKFGYRPKTDFTRVFEDALHAVAESQTAIEVNTAGLHKPCREIYPSADFLQIARRLDIPVTLGSDAHLPEETGQDFDKAVALLRRCGYNKICRFTLRKRELVPLTMSP